MSKATDEKEPRLEGLRVLTDAEAWEAFDKFTRRRVGMTGEEFLRAYDAGEVGWEQESPAVEECLMMMALVREVPDGRQNGG